MSAWRIAAVVLAAGLAGLGAAADDKKSAESKAPDFTGWVKHNLPRPIVGEVVKSDDKGFLLKVVTGASGGKPKYEQMQFQLHDAGLVRWKKLPPKTDGKGKPARYSPEERAELKLPRGAPGYAADPGDLKPGYVVELTMLRPKEIPPAKLVFQDLRVQYAVILTEDRGAAPGGKKDDEKKAEKKSDEKKEDKKGDQNG